MKAKSIFAASLLIAGAAFADTVNTVETEYVLGVLPLTVGKEAIINIPWVEAGSTSSGTTIAVENIIKTANLVAGDELYYYDPLTSKYQVWKVNSDATAWEGVTTTSSSGASVASTHEESLTRGAALILNRVNSYSTNASLTIYVVGQVPAATSTITIRQGYNLFAPTNVSGTTDLVSLIGNNAADGDQLILGVNEIYTWDDSAKKWTQPTYTPATFTWGTATFDSITLSAGSGVFYYRNSATTFALSFTAS